MKNNPQFIYLIPLGDVGDKHLEIIAESIQEQFGLEVKIAANQGLPVYALDAARQQYNSNLILRKLIDNAAPDAI
jgi:predicted Zn-dependent protease